MEQLEYMLSKIDQNYNLQMNNLKNLYNNIKYLDDEQQSIVIKAIRRLHNFLIYSFNKLNWQQPVENIKQENFTTQEIEMINSYIKKSQIGEDLKSHFFSLPYRKVENEILSQNEVNYKTKFFQPILSYQYFGYIKNYKPEGRGVRIDENSIQDGYFVDGQFVYGLSVRKYSDQPHELYSHYGFYNQDLHVDPIQTYQNKRDSLFSNYLTLSGQFQTVIQTIFSEDSQFLELYNNNLQKLQQEIKDGLFWYSRNESQLQFKDFESYSGEVRIGTKIKDGFGVWYDHGSSIIIQAIWNNDSPQNGLIIYRTRDLNLASHVGRLTEYEKFIR